MKTGGDEGDGHLYKDSGSIGLGKTKMVEAAGIEPASRDASALASTCLVAYLISRHDPHATGCHDASPVDLVNLPSDAGRQTSLYCDRIESPQAGGRYTGQLG